MKLNCIPIEENLRTASVKTLTFGRSVVCNFLLSIAVVILLLNAGCSTEKSSGQSSAAVLYISLIIHAEEGYAKDSATGEITKDQSRADYTNEVQFRHFSTAIRTLAEVFHKHGAKINFQSDWTFIQGVTQWDPLFFSDLEAMGHQVDAHAHETLVSYDEVWGMIKHANGNPSPVVGGFILDDVGQWSDRFNGEYYTFQILWGAGSMDHVNDPIQPGYAYRPSAEDWTRHDPQQKLVYIGQGERISGDYTGQSSFANAVMIAGGKKINTFSCLDITDYFLADPGTPGIPENFTAPYGDPRNWRSRIEAWDDWLTAVVDPYSISGKVEWKTLTEINDTYLNFEQQNPEWWSAL